MGSDEEEVFDNVIESIGNDGKFQKRFNWIFNFILVILASMPYLNIVLAMGVPDHWCYIPGREKTNLTIEEWKEIHLPKIYDERGKLAYSKCKFYNDTYSAHNADDTNIIECSQGWEFDQTWYKSTLPMQEGWVCGNQLYVTNTFVFIRIGELVGTFIFGQMADSIGRKPAFFITMITFVIGRTANAFTSSIPILFYVAVLIGSLPSTSVFMGPLVIAMEISKAENRALISMMQCLGWTLGLCLMPFILWAVQDWMYFMHLTTIPLIVYIFSKSFIIESPRWLLSKGKIAKCLKELKKIARTNGTKLPSNINALLSNHEDKQEQVYGVLALFSSWRLAKNSVLLILGWSATGAIYFMLTLNINNLDGNPYMNYFWQGLSEFPAYVLGKYASDRFGRRLTSLVSFLGTLIGCIPVLLIIQDESKAFLVSIIAIYLKFAISLAFYVVNLQSMEIYPTCIRQTGMSLGGITGNAVGIIIPYVIYLGTSVNVCYPYTIAAIFCIIGLITGIGLPETLNRKLPESLAEAAVFGADQDIWGKSRRKKDLEEAEKPLKEMS